MTIFVVGVILMTLLVVFSFKVIFSRCYAMLRIKCQNKSECAIVCKISSYWQNYKRGSFFSVEERYVPLQKSNTKEYNMPLERFTIYPQQNQMELLNDCLEEKNNENDPSIIFFSARAVGLSSNWDYWFACVSKAVKTAMTGKCTDANI